MRSCSSSNTTHAPQHTFHSWSASQSGNRQRRNVNLQPETPQDLPRLCVIGCVCFVRCLYWPDGDGELSRSWFTLPNQEHSSVLPAQMLFSIKSGHLSCKPPTKMSMYMIMFSVNKSLRVDGVDQRFPSWGSEKRFFFFTFLWFCLFYKTFLMTSPLQASKNSFKWLLWSGKVLHFL